MPVIQGRSSPNRTIAPISCSLTPGWSVQTSDVLIPRRPSASMALSLVSTSGSPRRTFEPRSSNPSNWK